MKEALALPSAARALLAEKLVESLEFDVDETLQKLWAGHLRIKLLNSYIQRYYPIFCPPAFQND